MSARVAAAGRRGVIRDLARPGTLASLAGVYGVSRVFGLLREVGVAYYFGTSIAADRFGAAFAAASLAGILVGEATYAGAIRLLSQDPSGGPALFRSTVLPLVARVAVVTTVAFALLGPPVMLATLGAGTDELWEVTRLALILAATTGAMVVSAGMNALLTFQGRITFQNSVQILYSGGALVAIGLIVIDAAAVDPAVVAAGWTAGNMAAASVLLACARLPRRVDRAARSATALLRVGAPIAVSFSLLAVQAIVAQAVAARLGTGFVAALTYADRLFLLPIGFVLAALGPIVLGTLSNIDSGDLPRRRAVSLAQLQGVTALSIPAALLFTAIAPALVETVFGRGAFGASSLRETTAAIDGFAIGIVPVAATLVGMRTMQALVEFRWIAVTAAGSVALYALLAAAAAGPLELFGVTLAWSLTAIGTLVLQLRILAMALGSDWRRRAARWLLPVAILAAAVSAAVVCLERADLIGRDLRFTALALAAGIAAALTARRDMRSG